MSDDVTITLEDSGQKGRYVARPAGLAEGDAPAELTFSRASARLVIVDHTGVPDALRGKGLGRRLAERIVADAREQGFKIMPLCPFFRAEAQRHPDWRDVLQG